MSNTNTGGPAFPIHPDMAAQLGCIPSSTNAGMTLRDYFASKAMPMAWDYSRRIDTGSGNNKEDKNEFCYDLLVDPDDQDNGDCEFIAGLAYRMADAMLKERIK